MLNQHQLHSTFLSSIK